jgi:hypothetical protein
VASSYSLFEVTVFPELNLNQTVEVMYQVSFLPGVDPPKTILTLQRKIDNLQMEVYQVHYEYVDIQTGRAKGVNFDSYIAMNFFPAFYHPKKRLIMVKAPKFLAHGAIRQLSENSETVRASHKVIILDSIKNRIEFFKGAWFKIGGSADVSSQALFGTNIDRDWRFERASSEGPLSFATFMYSFQGQYF